MLDIGCVNAERQLKRVATTAQVPAADRLLRHIVEHPVSGAFRVGADDLNRARRGRADTAFARQVAMYLAHITLGLTLTQVGRMFGRDRTTVAHACGIVEDRRDDRSFDAALLLLEAAIRATARRAVPLFGRADAPWITP